MKIPRLMAVFFCSAAALLIAAVMKAALVSGVDKMPPLKMLVFASSMFGLVVAGIDWALLRDLLPVSRAKSADATTPERGPEKHSALNACKEHGTGVGRLLDRARNRPIVFHEICPPPAAAGLSFYGGVPIGPPTLTWPRVRNKPGNAPLSFILQLSCADLAGQDVTGLLPHEGYFTSLAISPGVNRLIFSSFMRPLRKAIGSLCWFHQTCPLSTVTRELT
jgi:hypothetical protein